MAPPNGQILLESIAVPTEAQDTLISRKDLITDMPMDLGTHATADDTQDAVGSPDNHVLDTPMDTHTHEAMPETAVAQDAVDLHDEMPMDLGAHGTADDTQDAVGSPDNDVLDTPMDTDTRVPVPEAAVPQDAVGSHNDKVPDDSMDIDHDGYTQSLTGNAGGEVITVNEASTQQNVSIFLISDG
jgi:hypothetical protein